MKNKNTFYVIVLLLIVAGAVWYSFNTKKIVPQPVEQSQTPNSQVSQLNPDIVRKREMPQFILGSVAKIEGQKIFVTAGTEQKTILVNKTTIFVSQVKDGTGYKNVPAVFGNIKVSSEVVVYYGQNSGSEYTANKIQILNL